MKKLSSMAALGLALALTFGMTVSAAPSPTTDDSVPKLEDSVQAEVEKEVENNLDQYFSKVPQDELGVEYDKDAVILVDTGKKDENGEIVYESKKVDDVELEFEPKPLSKETLVNAVAQAYTSVATTEQAIASAGKLPAGQVVDKTVKPVVVAAADITLPGLKISTPLTITIKFDFTPASGKTYVLQHLEGGVWKDIVPESVGADGSVTATFSSLSPVVLKELTLTGEDTGSDDDVPYVENATITTGTVTPASPATSPKTAETLPVAGFMAVICLAGAAVCAKKVRYNK